MNTLRNIVDVFLGAWDSLAFRVVVICGALAAVPFYFLTLAMGAIR